MEGTALPGVLDKLPKASGNGKPVVTFLTDSKGNLSSMRVMSVVCVLAGVAQSFIGCWCVYKGIENAIEILMFSGSLITAGFTGKVVQKSQELKAENGGNGA